MVVAVFDLILLFEFSQTLDCEKRNDLFDATLLPQIVALIPLFLWNNPKVMRFTVVWLVSSLVSTKPNRIGYSATGMVLNEWWLRMIPLTSIDRSKDWKLEFPFLRFIPAPPRDSKFHPFIGYSLSSFLLLESLFSISWVGKVGRNQLWNRNYVKNLVFRESKSQVFCRQVQSCSFLQVWLAWLKMMQSRASWNFGESQNLIPWNWSSTGFQWTSIF